MRKPKLLFITPLPPPVHGSAMVSQVIRDSKLLNEQFDMEFVNLSTSRKLSEVGRSSYLLYFRKAFRFLGCYLLVLWKLLTHRYDLTYLAIAVHGVGFLKDFPFVMLARLLSRRYVIHQHNRGMEPYVDRAPYKWLLPMAYKDAHVIMLSWRLYPDVSRIVRREQLQICPNGLASPGAQNLDFGDISVVKGFRRGDGSVVPEILFLSNLIESKGVWILLDALRILQDRGVAFHCSFVGNPSESISEQQFLQGVIDRNLQSTVEYLGPRYGKDKWMEYQRADVFVLPSMDDCLPLTVVEAMMCGLPVVGSDIGAIPDLVEDGKTGFVVSSELLRRGDVQGIASLTSCLERLVLDSSLRQQMGETGRQRYNQLFTLKVFEERFCECINQILK